VVIVARPEGPETGGWFSFSSQVFGVKSKSNKSRRIYRLAVLNDFKV
jgi:hypothetical protein